MELIVTVLGGALLIAGALLFFGPGAHAPGGGGHTRLIAAAVLGLLGMSTLTFIKMGWRYGGFPAELRQLFYGVLSLSTIFGGMMLFVMTASGGFDEWWKPYGWQNLSFAGLSLAGALGLYAVMNRRIT